MHAHLFHFNMSICYFAHLLIVVNVDVNKVKRAALETAWISILVQGG